MAITTAPLIWDCYRQLTGSQELTGVAHYYDEQSQSLYLVDGHITTQVAEITDGHWEESIPDSPLTITNDSFSKMRLDHPSTGYLYGVATDGTSLFFLRYLYGMEISPFSESWTWTSQNDNAIGQYTESVRNIGVDIFEYEATLFQPGSRIILGMRMGLSQPYPMFVVWLDECTYDITLETVELSARNAVGYFLKDQTFDDQYIYNGVASDVITQILEYAGIKKYSVQGSGGASQRFKFDPSSSLLDGINEILSALTTITNEWRIVEIADGTVCIGTDQWLTDYVPNTYYSFNEGSDVFKRKTTKLSDSSYTALRVTGVDADDVALTPVTVPVTNFKYWALGTHRTNHIKAPDGLTQVQLQAWAEDQARKYQYIGIGEDFTGPLRPQLLVGDVAEVVEGSVGTTLGLITEVRQMFSEKRGFTTEFSVDSGGVMMEGGNYNIFSRAATVNGFNRRQRIIDLVRYVAK